MGRIWRLVVLAGSLAWASVLMPLAGDSSSQGSQVRVLVDPGHGGKDTGIRGPGEVLEKDVTLMIARELREIARSTEGLQVRLTRERDETFSWARRKGAAQGADLWIGLHLNADRGGKARGARVFYTQTAILDEPEGGPSGSESDVKAILRDMVLTKRYNESVLLAEHLQRALEKMWRVGSRPSAAAPLLGMGELECPAVLVEVGFLSHQADARRLLEPQGRKQLAEAILRGIRSFMKDPRRTE